MTCRTAGFRSYLDYNATAPLRPEAHAAMLASMDVVGNPSSAHAEGRAARTIVERAREQVAALVGARPGEVVLTSGASEANAAALAAGWDVVVLAPIEHDSVEQPARHSGAEIVTLPLEADGRADLAALADLVPRLAGKRALLTLQMANNETGIMQPVAEAAALAKTHGLVVHTDAVQAAGRLALDWTALGVDLMSLTAHKFGGPKGSGALIVRDGVPLPALIAGGGQERRRRAGTENVIGLAGFGAAAQAAGRDLADMARLQGLRDALEVRMRDVTPSAVVVGADSPRIPNTSAVAVPGWSAETLVIKLDLAGVAVSAGAACSSGKVGASRSLTGLGLPPDVARAAIRVSFGWQSSEADLESFLSVWAAIAADAASRRAVA